MKRNSTFYKDQIAWSGDTCFLFKKQGSLTKNKLRTLKAFINKNPDWFFKQTGETAPTDTFSLYLHIRDFYRRLKHKEIYFIERETAIPSISIASVRRIIFPVLSCFSTIGVS